MGLVEDEEDSPADPALGVAAVGGLARKIYLSWIDYEKEITQTNEMTDLLLDADIGTFGPGATLDPAVPNMIVLARRRNRGE